ncbi:MAG TPA: 3-deoxy-D-manno-octulosonic acid transferase [Candidatus Thioglobus sp.]|nr:3-deoxy-D-manno-octulosonic acid transferase [Candidatus Thioglobus sp.]
MNRSLYILLGYLLLPLAILRLLIKSIRSPDYSKRILERIGIVVDLPVPVIWIHCVSVGEFRAATVLIDRLITNYPDHRVLVTTTTVTGSRAVADTYNQKVLHFYFPFDVPIIVNRYIKKIKPSVCVLLETEIWPNLIHSLHKKNVPVVLVNARMSERSLKRYKKFSKKLSLQTLNKLSLIAAQNNNSMNRFIELGAKPKIVINTGNIKFDQKHSTNEYITKQISAFKYKRDVVVFSSTRKGEEAQIIKSYLKYQGSINNALLVIIPRHPERFDEVYKLANKHKLGITRRSSNNPSPKNTILLGDSMGEMMSYFDVSDIVFVGGSLSNTGGQNMLEPAALSKPIIFGPSVFNFAEISSSLLSIGGAVQVQNSDELFETVIRLLENKKERQELGKNAYQFLLDQQGATDRIQEQLRGLF